MMTMAYIIEEDDNATLIDETGKHLIYQKIYFIKTDTTSFYDYDYQVQNA